MKIIHLIQVFPIILQSGRKGSIELSSTLLGVLYALLSPDSIGALSIVQVCPPRTGLQRNQFMDALMHEFYSFR